jgi:DNA-binding NarL/FixJ family response regulator
MLPLFVVIVDSDPRFLEIATRFLQKRTGTLVYSAVSKSDEILRQVNIFEPDILLYNLSNSDSKSLETIKQLRNKFSRITIIVVAPPENGNFKQAVMEAGANDFVLRNALNLEFLPAIWCLITMYQQRYGKSSIGTIAARSNPFFAPSILSSEPTNQPPFIN